MRCKKFSTFWKYFFKVFVLNPLEVIYYPLLPWKYHFNDHKPLSTGCRKAWKLGGSHTNERKSHTCIRPNQWHFSARFFCMFNPVITVLLSYQIVLLADNNVGKHGILSRNFLEAKLSENCNLPLLKALNPFFSTWFFMVWLVQKSFSI